MYTQQLVDNYNRQLSINTSIIFPSPTPILTPMFLAVIPNSPLPIRVQYWPKFAFNFSWQNLDIEFRTILSQTRLARAPLEIW